MVEEERAVRLHRIRVEVLVSSQGNAGEQAIVESLFQDVDVPRVPREQEEAVVPHDRTDRRTGFPVRGEVGKLKGFAEGLGPVSRAYGAGEVDLGFHHVTPDRFDGR